MKALIGEDNEAITLSELVVVPSFLRFDNVSLDYSSFRTHSLSIAEKCESIRGYLSLITASLYDSNITRFCCAINEKDPSQFTDHSGLLEHIRQVVSICDTSRGYAFSLFDLYTTDFDSGGHLIASLLNMPEIARSSYVYISCLNLNYLPIEIISNWLNREHHEMGKKQQELNLELVCPIQDALILEICDFLKQVSFIFSNI